jgi:putative transposase
LTDHLVINPRYRGKILTDKVAFVAEGIIRNICAEMDIKIIDIAINIDHVHLFFQYPPKYSLSNIAKKIKGRSSRLSRKEFPNLRE